MNVVTNPALAATPLPGIRHATLAGEAQGLKALPVWSQILEPGATTPVHRHECDEVVLCMQGRGEVHYEGGKLEFGRNSTVSIPRDVIHQVVNSGNEPLHLIAAFGQSPVDIYLPDGDRLTL